MHSPYIYLPMHSDHLTRRLCDPNSAMQSRQWRCTSKKISVLWRALRCASCQPTSWTSIQGPSAPNPTRTKVSYVCSSSRRAVEQTATLRRGNAIVNAFQERLANCWATIFPTYIQSLVNLFITVHGIGTQVLFLRPKNSDFDHRRFCRLKFSVFHFASQRVLFHELKEY